MNSICVTFMEILLRRKIDPKLIITFCLDLRPFLDYIEDVYQVTSLDKLKHEHVEAYTETIRARYRPGHMSFQDALDANCLLGAVRMFCLQMFIERLLPEDYSVIPVIPFPLSEERSSQYGKNQAASVC